MRLRFVLPAAVLAVLAVSVWLFLKSAGKGSETAHPKPVKTEARAPVDTAAARGATRIYAHNLLLRKGPEFRVYVRWLQGEMTRLKREVNPSFDDPDSFYLNIRTGILRANIGDLANYLNRGLEDSPLKNISLSGNGGEIRLRGTLKKAVALPIELVGELSPLPDDRIRVHVTKLNVLKIPFKGLLGLFRVSVSDLFKNKTIDGVSVEENDIYFDTQKLLPPPHIKGHLTAVRVANPDLEEVFGDAQEQVDRVEEWRNFLRLKGGTIDFGKLTMRNVDLIMIDISKDPWFDLDLTNYQKQLTNGFTRVTPESGLQIFMPDLRDIPARTQNTSIEWFKNRDIPPPPEIVVRR